MQKEMQEAGDAGFHFVAVMGGETAAGGKETVVLSWDSVGNTKEVPIAVYVDVGVFGDRVPGQKLGELLLVKKVKLTQPVTVLDFVVPKEPKKAGIDPYNKLIDRTPEDNVIEVVKAEVKAP